MKLEVLLLDGVNTIRHSLRSYQDLDFKTHFQKYKKFADKKCLSEFFLFFLSSELHAWPYETKNDIFLFQNMS